MITSEQELMSSGGLEKPQTTSQIELGVLKTSVIVSLSKWTSKSTLNLKIYFSPSEPAIREYVQEDGDYEYGFYEMREIVESRNRKRISGEILDHFKRTSIVRYIEAWNGIYKINREYILRGLHGTPEFEKTLAGVFGAFNKKVFQRSDDDWDVIDFGKLYPQVRRLSQEGVERIRSVFREIKIRNDSKYSP